MNGGKDAGLYCLDCNEKCYQYADIKTAYCCCQCNVTWLLLRVEHPAMRNIGSNLEQYFGKESDKPVIDTGEGNPED